MHYRIEMSARDHGREGHAQDGDDAAWGSVSMQGDIKLCAGRIE